MIPIKQLCFSSALSMIKGLRTLFRQGLRPRDLLFMALDSRGDVHLAIPEHTRDMERLRVGEKLSLSDPFLGRYYHLDAVHPAGGNVIMLNGDRRIGQLSSLVDVAELISWFIKEAGDVSIFFGCTPHQPGSWRVQGENATALHNQGFVEIVPTHSGLLARRTMDDGLFYLPAERAIEDGSSAWQRVYTSPLGNVLMLERRVLYDQLVLSCQRGLVEVDVYDLPRVSESGRFSIDGGYAVVGRITGGAFAVARGVPRDWGFESLQPATLVGSKGALFMELRLLLA